ncbi:rCG26896 [Rattus norvegicus]|uniref:RCG26896 n=1 Tax=Rattus norvegicus TaxID=10116 RepID=A6HQE6_RAT|nr:rCG26896 [Rattus norvegicus]
MVVLWLRTIASPPEGPVHIHLQFPSLGVPVHSSGLHRQQPTRARSRTHTHARTHARTHATSLPTHKNKS